jgi:tetratricopeptide (TPR) repeat protein
MNDYRFVLCLAIMLAFILPAGAADDAAAMNTAGALYSQSVDLANEGKYQQALDASDKALAMNVTALTGLLQSNRAGILVMLKRNNEAITAADAALAIEGNLTAVHSIAWYNKGNALRNLGRTAEAKDAYDNAYALDNTLVPPDLSGDVPNAASPAATAKSPLTPLPLIVAFGIAAGIVCATRKN